MALPGHNELINTLRPRQDGRHFADDIFKCIFLNKNVWIPIKISQKFVPKGAINNIPALVQIMAWRRPGDKPLSEPMMVSLLTHICITRPQWDKEAKTDDTNGSLIYGIRNLGRQWFRYSACLVFIEFIYFHSQKCTWKCCLQDISHPASMSQTANLTCYMLLLFSWLQLMHIHESLIGVNQSLDHGLSSIWPQAI